MKLKKVIVTLTSIVLILAIITVLVTGYLLWNGKKTSEQLLTQDDFLKTSGKELVTNSGNTIRLKGTNAGGWLLQEFWMTPTEESENVKAELDIYQTLSERFGERAMYWLINLYENQYWTETDFENCQEMGMNCIRLPFWYRNLVDENGNFYGYEEGAEDPYAEAFKRIDWFIEKAGEYGIYVILDFHGAPGSQNGSDHSGEDGGADKVSASEFFFGENIAENQELFLRIWEVIAARYAGNPVIAGYDLLNEPYSSYRYRSSYSDEELHRKLWRIYDEAYERIRAIDSEHIIIMEGMWEPADLPNPQYYGWKNVMYEYHSYQFNDVDNKNGGQITQLQTMISQIEAADYNVPSYIGEFTLQNSIEAWETGLAMLNYSGISWTTWTYKTTEYYANWGLYHHVSDIGEVNMETSSFFQIMNQWLRVGKCTENTELVNVVKKYCH